MDAITRARINRQLLDTLARLLARRVRDPRVREVTLTAVEVTNDLSYARVFYSVMGDDEAQRVAQRGLEHAARFLRHEVGRLMRLRTIPQLRFVYDDSMVRGQRIESVLREIQDSGRSGADAGPDDPEPGTEAT